MALLVCKCPTLLLKKIMKKYGILSRVLGYGIAQQLLYVGERSKCIPFQEF